MGDSQNDTVRVDFDRKIKLEFHGSTVTSDAGFLAYREIDEALQLTSTAATGLHDTRTRQNTQHRLLALLRQSIYSRLVGYEDVNDAERLCLDPALRAVVGGRAKVHTAASTSEMARFETETLSTKENLKHLMDLFHGGLPRACLDSCHNAYLTVVAHAGNFSGSGPSINSRRSQMSSEVHWVRQDPRPKPAAPRSHLVSSKPRRNQSSAGLVKVKRHHTGPCSAVGERIRNCLSGGKSP